MAGIDPMTATHVTVIVPTYREAENLPHLIERLARLREREGLNLELLIMDDDDHDGTAESIAARPEPWVQLVVRRASRGLSAAVLDGLRRADGDVLVCMDADLSHPPEALPQMLEALRAGADFVIGSRYVYGGSTAEDWGPLRRLNSRIATALARPLTSAQDPMAGYFALTRQTYERGRDFNPVGYKIALELIVKCRCKRVVEIPIHFENRRLGKSKLTVRQQLLYLRHLRRLYAYKYGPGSELSQFLRVGALGTVVNLAVLTALINSGLTARVAIGVAIIASMSSNFLLNRRFSSPYARLGRWWPQYLRFAATCSLGALINYVVALLLLSRHPEMVPQIAALIGIAAGAVGHFAASRWLVFRMPQWRLHAR